MDAAAREAAWEAAYRMAWYPLLWALAIILAGLLGAIVVSHISDWRRKRAEKAEYLRILRKLHGELGELVACAEALTGAAEGLSDALSGKGKE